MPPSPPIDAPPGSGLTSRLTLRAVVLVTAGTALVARLAYWVLATPDRRLTSDAAQYDYLASNLAEGQGFSDYFPQMELHPTAFRPPGYPAVLSIVYRVLWPSPGIGRGVNVLIGVAVVVALVLLVDRHLGRRSALAAGLAVALWPNLIANDTYVLTEPLSLLLLVGLLWFLLEDRWLLAGLLTGCLVLTRPSAQYLVVILAAYLLWKLGWRRALLFAGATAVVVAPWLVRNWIQLGSPVLVTSNGFNYAALYSPPADEHGAFIDATRHPYFDDRRLDQFDEVLWDRNLRRTAIDHVKERPAVVPEVVGRNVTTMFELEPWRNRAPDRLDGRSMGVRSATFWVLWPLVVLGVAGMARRGRRHRLVLLAALIGGYFTLASLVFVSPPRLRSPMELMLVIGAAALLAIPRRQPEPAEEPPGAGA